MLHHKTENEMHLLFFFCLLNTYCFLRKLLLLQMGVSFSFPLSNSVQLFLTPILYAIWCNLWYPLHPVISLLFIVNTAPPLACSTEPVTQHILQEYLINLWLISSILLYFPCFTFHIDGYLWLIVLNFASSSICSPSLCP